MKGVLKKIFNNENLNITINVFIHVAILFSFLTIIFWSYIKNIEKTNVQQQLGQITENSTINILNKFMAFKDEWNKNNSEKIIITKEIWGKIISWCNQEIQKSSQTNEYITKHNNDIFKTVTIIMIILWVVTLFLIITAKFILKKKFPLKWIISQNICLFIVIGFLEFWFFTKIASKYIPTSSSDISITVLDEFKKFL